MKRKFDTFLFLPALFLLAYGVVMVFSASTPTAAQDPSCHNDPYFFFKREIVWILIGFAAMIVGYRLNIVRYRKFAVPLMIATMGLLVLVLIIGVDILGARRSFNFGPLTFQPSELAKIALIFYFADALARRREKVENIKYSLIPLMLFGIVAILVEKEPDLGTTLVLAGTVIGMLFMSGVNFWHIFGLLVVGATLATVKVLGASYRMKRLLSFLNPSHDPQGTGYQIKQSFIALGSGGLFGLGLGESRQKFGYLPEKFTDFIFSVIGEEMGLLYGTLPVVILFVWFFYKGMQAAARTKDPFLSLLAGGITFQIVIQGFMNMGVAAGILPCTGIPLPFISYGGSSLLFTLFSLGLLLNIAGTPRQKWAEEISKRAVEDQDVTPIIKPSKKRKRKMEQLQERQQEQ